jgi:hypothetical protein
LPAGAVAIVMYAEPGQELTCFAHNHRFQEEGRVVNQGVLSYFASRSLPQSRTMQDWFQATVAALAAKDDIPRLARPRLQMQGRPDAPVP